MVVALDGRTPYLGNVSAQQVKGELESLDGFKKRVDGIIKDLEGSKASQTNVRRQEVTRAAFGGEFAEAQDLYAEYNRVHTHLTNLSGVLGDQIEAMRIAIHAVDTGFTDMEEATQRRFWELQSKAQLHEQQSQKPGDQQRADDTKVVM
ncbi:hypothetical protein N566_26095 [Streptomycetaceae bacterium MP113-05]|nr:hypothetical protein N566_26095 [Streptomycetaceae bacterium MP113-05]